MATKGKALRILHEIACMINEISWNGLVVTRKQALRPASDATSLTPLGCPLMFGFARRPIWADRRTPRTVVLNTWKAKEEHSTVMSKISLLERRARKFADMWQLQMRGHKSQSRIRGNTKPLPGQRCEPTNKHKEETKKAPFTPAPPSQRDGSLLG